MPPATSDSNRENDEADILLRSIVDGAWRDANTAMHFYIGYRARYNLPYAPEMWMDDFALGFREAIAHVHFFMRNPKAPTGMATQWQERAFPDDRGLAQKWMELVNERSERAHRGMRCAFILETWRIGQEFMTGALDYIAAEEKSYLDRYPDSSRFQYNHWLLLSHFIIPLIEDDRYAHPSISAHFSQLGPLSSG